MMTMQKQYAYFSAAIRDGILLHEQGFFALRHRNRTCAIGAGLEAMCVSIPRFPDPDSECDFAKRELSAYPYLTAQRERFPCPQRRCVQTHICLFDAILDLNDEHKWTREEIANWLYTEEEKLGFITISCEDTQSFNPEMISEFSTVKATEQFSCLNRND